MMSIIFSDLRQFFRSSRKSPGLFVVVILTLGVGIGSNNAIFSLVNGILLKPLPYPESERLVALWHAAPGLGVPRFAQSDATLLVYRERSKSFQEVAGYDLKTYNLSGAGDPEQLVALSVTPAMFRVLQIKPELGRPFIEADGESDAKPVVILTHGLWVRKFGGDPAALGRTLELDGLARTIVGVMPAGDRSLDPDAQLWTPLQIDRSNLRVTSFGFVGVGRLRDGVSIERAEDEVNGLLRQLQEFYPGEWNTAAMERARVTAFVLPLQENVVGDVEQVLWILLGTVGFVLLIACTNVANLFLVRVEGRQWEMALRAALGAGRGRIATHFLVDSLGFSFLGCLVGMVLGESTIALLRYLQIEELPRLAEVSMDATVVVFTISVALVAGILLGTLPMLRVGRQGLFHGLKEGGRTSTDNRHRHRTQNSLVVIQMALAMILLVGCGLMVRSFIRLQSVDPGFDPTNVLTLRVVIPESTYTTPLEVGGFYQQLITRVQGLAGVESVSAISWPPLATSGAREGLWIEDFPPEPNAVPYVPLHRYISPGYFATLRIPILEGRDFRLADQEQSTASVIVSKALARHFWNEASPLGKRVRRERQSSTWYTIVGIVGDVRNDGLQEPPSEIIYFPIAGRDPAGDFMQRTMALTVKTLLPADVMAAAVRSEVRALDPRVPIANIETMDEIVARSFARRSFTLVMLAIASSFSLFLGVVGIYGVTAYVVSQRRQEIGLRMALGARPLDVRKMILKRGLMLALMGTAAGLIGSLGLTQLLASLLFETQPYDPGTLILVTGLLLTVTVLACLVPARGAMRIDPSEALRQGN